MVRIIRKIGLAWPFFVFGNSDYRTKRRYANEFFLEKNNFLSSSGRSKVVDVLGELFLTNFFINDTKNSYK